MKREIVCPKCELKLRKLFPKESPYPGEHVKFINGLASIDFICDQCGEPILTKNECAAVSFWADYGGIPYFEWEEDYLLQTD